MLNLEIIAHARVVRAPASPRQPLFQVLAALLLFSPPPPHRRATWCWRQYSIALVQVVLAALPLFCPPSPSPVCHLMLVAVLDRVEDLCEEEAGLVLAHAHAATVRDLLRHVLGHVAAWKRGIWRVGQVVH